MMMFKNFRMNKPENILLVIAVVVVVFCLLRKRSTYMLSPTPVEIKTPEGAPSSIFDLPCKPECVPSSKPTADYYTKDLTPCGICGAQEFVRSQAEDYQIVDGIGGSLLN